jgi:hypothetical protein
MAGIDGLGHRATGGGRTGDALDLAAALDHAGMFVNRENVLALRAGFLQEATDLQEVIDEKRNTLDVGLCGGDPVSPEARAGFKECTDLLLDQVQARIDALNRAGEELGVTARAYGHTEDTIDASFRLTPPGSTWSEPAR